MEERNDRFKRDIRWGAEILGDKVELRATFELLDKDRAKDILSRSYGNQRTRNDAHVDRIVEAMNAGEFIDAVINPIFISNTNKLLDGQHRLTALTHTNKTIPFFVVRGLPEETFVYIDQNKTRSGSDAVKVAGFRNPNKISAAAKLVYQLMQGKASVPRNELLVRMVEDYPDLESAVARAESMTAVTHIPGTVGAALYFLYSRKYPDECKMFFDLLQYGGEAMKHRNHPAARLRKLLNDEWGKVGGKRMRGDWWTTQGTNGGNVVYDERWRGMAFIHQAFIAYVTGTRFSWNADQEIIESIGQLCRKTVTLRHSYNLEGIRNEQFFI